MLSLLKYLFIFQRLLNSEAPLALRAFTSPSGFFITRYWDAIAQALLARGSHISNDTTCIMEVKILQIKTDSVRMLSNNLG